MNKESRFLSQEKWDEIFKRIEQGDFYSDIAKDYGITNSAISYQAKKKGIFLKNRFKRKNIVNDTFFNEIDNEEKAYWLGFIMANGGICYTTSYYKKCETPNRLYFTLSLNDKIILEDLCHSINYDKNKIIEFIPKGTYSNNPMCKLNINSKRICQGLKAYGVIPSKTGVETFPNLPENLIRHFIRGFFDGDGSVWESNGMKHISFTGNYNFLNDLKNYLYNNNIIDNKDYAISKYKNKEAYNFGFAKKESIVNFKNFIYKDSNIYLKRKYNKF